MTETLSAPESSGTEPPAEESRRPAKQQHRNSEFHLRPTEVRQLITAAQSGRDRLIVSLLAYTGMRRAELRDLVPSDLYLESGEVLIRNGKGGKQRIVFLPHGLDELIRHQLSRASRLAVFPGRSGLPLSLRSVNLIVARCGRQAGLRNPNPRYRSITPHLLRHSMARNWKRAGGSLESLQKILGHASMKTTLDLYGTEAVTDTKENYMALAHRLVSEGTSAVQ